MPNVDEAIVVGKLDERPRPEAFDRLDFGDHFLHRLQLVSRRAEDRARAELALVRTAPARLDRDAVVLIRIERVEARQERVLPESGLFLVPRNQ